MAFGIFPKVDGTGQVVGYDSVNDRELDSENNREKVAQRLGFETFAAVQQKVQEIRSQAESTRVLA